MTSATETAAPPATSIRFIFTLDKVNRCPNRNKRFRLAQNDRKGRLALECFILFGPSRASGLVSRTPEVWSRALTASRCHQVGLAASDCGSWRFCFQPAAFDFPSEEAARLLSCAIRAG